MVKACTLIVWVPTPALPLMAPLKPSCSRMITALSEWPSLPTPSRAKLFSNVFSHTSRLVVSLSSSSALTMSSCVSPCSLGVVKTRFHSRPRRLTPTSKTPRLNAVLVGLKRPCARTNTWLPPLTTFSRTRTSTPVRPSTVSPPSLILKALFGLLCRFGLQRPSNTQPSLSLLGDAVLLGSWVSAPLLPTRACALLLASMWATLLLRLASTSTTLTLTQFSLTVTLSLRNVSSLSKTCSSRGSWRPVTDPLIRMGGVVTPSLLLLMSLTVQLGNSSLASKSTCLHAFPTIQLLGWCGLIVQSIPQMVPLALKWSSSSTLGSPLSSSPSWIASTTFALSCPSCPCLLSLRQRSPRAGTPLTSGLAFVTPTLPAVHSLR